MAEYKSLVKKISLSPEMKTKQKDYLKTGNLRIVDQGQDLIGGYTNDTSKKIQCELPVVVFGDHTRVVKYIDFPFGAGADGIKILQPQKNILPKFLFYGTQYLVFRLDDKGYARHYQHIEKKNLITPVLAEQQSIVARIEELFSELDKGVTQLQKVKAQLKIYRQAIYKNVIGKHNWKMTPLKEIVQTIDGDRGSNYPHKTDYLQKGYCLFLSTKNVRKYGWKWDELCFISKEKHEQLRNGQIISQDVVITTRGTLGNVAVFDDDVPFSIVRINSGMLILRKITTAINEYYLANYLMSPMFYAQLKKRQTGTAQPQIPANILREIKVPLPPEYIQIQIVQEIDSLLTFCDKIEQTVDESLKKAEHLRQSILKQAFEGKLV